MLDIFIFAFLICILAILLHIIIGKNHLLLLRLPIKEKHKVLYEFHIMWNFNQML